MPISFILNSTNARVLDRERGSATFDLTSPLLLHGKSVGRLVSLSIYNDMPNIRPPNNTIEFVYSGTTITFTFSEGSYSMQDIGESLRESLDNAGLAGDFMVLVADESNSFVSIRVNYGIAPFSINYDVNNGILSQLGFTGLFSAASGAWEESSSKAELNVVNAIIINISFASGAYLNGNAGSNAVDIAEFPPLQSGTQFIHRPFHLNAFDINERVIDSFTVRLTTENGTTPYITSEPWTMLITIEDNITE